MGIENQQEGVYTPLPWLNKQVSDSVNNFSGDTQSVLDKKDSSDEFMRKFFINLEGILSNIFIEFTKSNNENGIIEGIQIFKRFKEEFTPKLFELIEFSTVQRMPEILNFLELGLGDYRKGKNTGWIDNYDSRKGFSASDWGISQK